MAKLRDVADSAVMSVYDMEPVETKQENGSVKRPHHETILTVTLLKGHQTLWTVSHATLQ